MAWGQPSRVQFGYYCTLRSLNIANANPSDKLKVFDIKDEKHTSLLNGGRIYISLILLRLGLWAISKLLFGR